MAPRSAQLCLMLLLGNAQAAEPVKLYTVDYPPFTTHGGCSRGARTASGSTVLMKLPATRSTPSSDDILQTMYRDGTIRRIYTQYGYEKEMPR